MNKNSMSTRIRYIFIYISVIACGFGVYSLTEDIYPSLAFATALFTALNALKPEDEEEDKEEEEKVG